MLSSFQSASASVRCDPYLRETGYRNQTVDLEGRLYLNEYSDTLYNMMR